MAKISVIMTTYNDDKHISESIESILHQSFSDFEFIICDDCSTDSTPLIIEKFAKSDSRIRFVRNKENIGFCKCLNLCISMASSPYLARMDSDDVSMPDRFEKEFSFLQTHSDYSVCSCSELCIDEHTVWGLNPKKGDVTIQNSIKNSCISHGGCMMRKDDIQKVGLYTVWPQKIRCAEDYDLWLKILANGGKLYNLSDFLYCYRECRSSYKRRKFKYQLAFVKLKRSWRKKLRIKPTFDISQIKDVLVGLLPRRIYQYFHRRRMIKFLEQSQMQYPIPFGYRNTK